MTKFKDVQVDSLVNCTIDRAEESASTIDIWLSDGRRIMFLGNNDYSVSICERIDTPK